MNLFKRLAALLLAAVLIIGLFPVGASAEEQEPLTFETTYINPIYADIVSEEDIPPVVTPKVQTYETVHYVTTAEDAGVVLREQMKARIEAPVVHIFANISATQEEFDALCKDLYEVAITHTQEPNEGDYILWHLSGYEATGKLYAAEGGYNIDITYSMVYHSNAEQEAAVDAAVEELLAQLNLSGRSDYEKVKAVYDYICKNVRYDKTSSGTLKHTAYAALIKKTAVCQGYASLLYRLLLELGVDTRVIAGSTSNGDHGWNIVELDTLYYNADSTWDEGNTSYSWFLKSPDNFPDHNRFAEYTTAAFTSAYPMASADYVPHPHSYSTAVTAPTCTEQGYTTYTCSCGDTYVGDYVDATGHSFGSWYETKAPTETATGLERRDCANCDHYETREVDKLPHTHNHTAVVTPPTCTQQGYTTYTCDCGDTYTDNYVDATNHSFGDWYQTKAPTETATGLERRDCANCDHYETREVAKLEPSDPYSGSCGDDLTWNFDETSGQLTVSGSGAMYGADKLGWTNFKNNIRSVEIGSGATSVGAYAFADCENLTDVQMPNSVMRIAYNAFENCSSLTAVDIPDNVTEIAYGAFMDCSSLTAVDIPDNVTEISYSAFKDCTSLASLELPQNVMSISYHAFDNCTSLSEVDFPTSLASIGDEAFGSCTGLNEMHFTGNAPAIQSKAFSKVAADAYYPAANTTWTADVLQNYGGTLTWIAEGGTVEPDNSCGENITWAFEESTGTLTISGKETMARSNGISVMDDYARPEDAPWYAYQDQIITIIIEGTVDSIGKNAFAGCSNLTTVIIEEGVSEIDDTAFSDCDALENCYFEGSEDQWDDLGADIGDAIIHTESAEPETHTETKKTVAPTCTEQGYDLYTCSCGTTRKDNFTEPTDHQWDDGVVTKEPTAAAPGIKTYTCTVCKTTRTEEIPYEAPVVSGSIQRISGKDRVKTALSVARALKDTLKVDKFDAVIIATGVNEKFADALAGSYLANRKKAPILLYTNSGLSQLNVTFIQENLKSGGTVYILGGDSAVPTTVEETLSAYNVVRLSGKTRYETNLEILKEAGISGNEILVATGNNFADSLSASAVGLPLLLVNGKNTSLNAAQTEFLKSVAGKKITIMGGDSAVSEEMKAAIEAVTGVTAERISGKTRHNTSVLIAQKYFTNADAALITYSQNFPDGLAGGPLAYALGAPLLLTNAGQEAIANEYIAAESIESGYVLGGDSAVSDETARKVFGLPADAVINKAWEEYYTVTFESNGGSAVEAQVVEAGQTATAPEAPTMEGYTFTGWYTDAELTTAYDFATPVTADIVLYAKWGITRGAWIDRLVTDCGYPYTADGELATFADVSESQYRTVIETAVVYGILDAAPETTFKPDTFATREFAAETAVRCMGYFPTGELSCTDADQVENLAAAQIAVDLGLLALENDFYYPDRDLTVLEAEQIMEVVANDIDSASGDDDSHDGFVFLENVVINSDKFDWEESGNTVVLPEGEEIPEVGQIIVFGTEKAIKVEDVTTMDGQTKITYSEPELYEFLDYIDVQGNAQLDFSNFIPAEGVTIIENSASRSNSDVPVMMYSSNEGIQTAGFMDDWFDVDEENIEINDPVSLTAKAKITDNIDVVVDLDINIPSVGYKFDIDFDFAPFNDEPLANVKNAYVKFSNDITTHVEVVVHNNSDPLVNDLVYPPYIELGSIPLVGVDGIGIVLEIDLVLNAEGKFELDYRVHGTLGAQVRNNKAKNISALQSSSSVGLSGALKIGPQVNLLAEVFGEDLLKFTAEAGVQGKGSVYKRSTGLVCMDAGITLFAELKAFEECLIDDWLEIAVKFTIWDEESSPLQLRGHWENLERVTECTYNNSGTIKGTIANAENRTQYIEGASIKVLTNGSMENVTTAYSDEKGEYVAIVPGGTYIVQISADGYIPFESLETVGESQIIYLETYLLVAGSEDSNETGNIGGIVSNAVTGMGIPNVKLTVRKGWNKTSGNVVTTIYTDDSGKYSVELPLGNYTIAMECNGYVSNHFNVAVTRSGDDSCNSVLNPDGNSSIELGDMRIILEWTDEPSDLDSHLWGPTVDGSNRFHIYYSNMSYDIDGVIYAYLDRDDVDYEGPETTTVYDMTANGVYSFYVHDFTNSGNGSSTVMANSGAKVSVYMGEKLIAQYHIPTSGVGSIWHVFDFDATTGTITAVNTFGNGSSSQVGANIRVDQVALMSIAPETKKK